MTFAISQQQRQMIATVRELAQGEFRNDAIKYMDGTFPWENMKKLAQLGVLGMSVPEEYGGMGLDSLAYLLALEEIAARAATQNVVVVSHVSPIKSAVTWALGAGPEMTWRMSLDRASICTVNVGRNGPSLVSFNETHHLVGVER